MDAFPKATPDQMFKLSPFPWTSENQQGDIAGHPLVCWWGMWNVLVRSLLPPCQITHPVGMSGRAVPKPTRDIPSFLGLPHGKKLMLAWCWGGVTAEGVGEINLIYSSLMSFCGSLPSPHVSASRISGSKENKLIPGNSSLCISLYRLYILEAIWALCWQQMRKVITSPSWDIW